MNKQLEALIAEMKATAEMATPLQLDTAQLKRGNDGWIECPCCEGAGDVEAESDFCNIDGKALGVQFYGIGEHHGLAEQYFRQASPANVLALIAALEKSQQHNKELQVKLDATEAVALALRDEVRGAEKRVAELESTLELEREKSRRVMSQNHQLEVSPLAVKLPDLVNFDDLDANSQDREVVESIAQCKGWNAAIEASRRMNDAVELLRQAAPHMLADESLKDPGGVLCGKARSVPDGWVMVPRKITLEMECALSRADSYEIGWQWAIAAAPKPDPTVKK